MGSFRLWWGTMLQERDPTRSERELLDTIERGGRSPAGRTAVQLHLSQLLPSNRTDSALRIAARLFAPLEKVGSIQVFLLASGDLFILGKDMPEADVELIVQRVRSLFEKDPLTFEDFSDDNDPFVTWYAYETELKPLIETVGSLLDISEMMRRRQMTLPKPPPPLQPHQLELIHEKLRTLNMRPLLRRQPCIYLNDRKQAEILFEEFTIGIGEIAEAIAPGQDLFADRWLFQDLSRTLDGGLLHALPAVPMLDGMHSISINLNLESLDHPDFLHLLRRMQGHQRLVVEVQVIDVFTNLTLYQQARQRLRRHGHAILLDGLSPEVLSAMALPLLDPDYVKILWAADLAAGRHSRKGQELASIIADLGASRVILSRCESEIAMSWGMGQGISAFQGRFVDAVLATMTMQACPSSASCSLRACMGRRASAMGRRRCECPNPPWLDKIQSFSAPTQRRAVRAPAQS